MSHTGFPFRERINYNIRMQTHKLQYPTANVCIILLLTIFSQSANWSHQFLDLAVYALLSTVIFRLPHLQQNDMIRAASSLLDQKLWNSFPLDIQYHLLTSEQFIRRPRECSESTTSPWPMTMHALTHLPCMCTYYKL